MEEIINKWEVAIRCHTFNHSDFITETLNGFVEQETKFPYIILLVDDASTDGAQEIIRNYVSNNFETDNKSVAYDRETEYYYLTYAQHKSNNNCFIAALYLKVNHYSRPEFKGMKLKYLSEWRNKAVYEAVCEGDDFWINPHKLQMQVDFLENNQDYSVCSHRIYKYDSEFNTFWADRLSFLFKNKQGISYSNKSRVWLCETSSLVFRMEIAKQYDNYKGLPRDNVRMYFLLLKHKGMCLKETMSVYRQHSGGIFSKQSIETKLVDGSYRALKDLYINQKDSDSRYLYYRCYANTFIATKGAILLAEKVDLIKLLSLVIFIPTIVFGIHPVYEKIDNKPW